MLRTISFLGVTTTVLLASACSSDSGSGNKNQAIGTGGAFGGSAAGSTGVTDTGGAATTTPPTNTGGVTTITPSSSGGAPVGSGGAASSTGGTTITATGGSSSSGGTPSGGTSSMAGSAGMMMGGAAGSAGGGVQPTGDAPTVMSASNAGPYKVVTYTSGYAHAAGVNFADATVHYPMDGTPPFPLVAVVPGFVSPQSSIQNWGPFLASHGIVTMTIGTNSPTDPPATRELALMDALASLAGENTRMGSPLVGKLDTSRKATMGWSMGGGGTLLAASDHPDLKATVAMCAWNPGYQYSKDTVPSFMFAGTADTLAGGQSQGFYTSIPMATPKELYEVTGGSHFVANDPAGENKQIGLYGLSWLEVFLVGDMRYKQFLTVKPMNSTTFENNLM